MSNTECDHSSYQTIGKMDSTPVEGVYVIPCKCDCGIIFFEKYYFEGIIEDKENPEV